MGKASKDKRDAYYRLAKEQGWRARSAFKLLQLNEEFNLFEGVTRVVDLCAAPGSWSQVLSRVLIKGETFDPTSWAPEEAKAQILNDERYEKKLSVAVDASGGAKQSQARDIKIVAIDLQPMMPLEGITTLAADITHPSTVPLLLKALDPETYDATSLSASHPVDLVVSDGAPDAIALHDVDMYIQSQLLFSALNLALCVLKPGGTFVSKIFRGKDVDLTYARLRAFFKQVTVAKPRSSRASSIEAFVVCQGFDPPAGFEPSLSNPLGPTSKLQVAVSSTKATASRKVSTSPTRTMRDDGIVELNFGSEDEDEEGNARWIPSFVACGHPCSYDSDATYRLPKDRQSLDPVQPPTAPPYKRALEMRRAAGGAYGKTKK